MGWAALVSGETDQPYTKDPLSKAVMDERSSAEEDVGEGLAGVLCVHCEVDSRPSVSSWK